MVKQCKMFIHPFFHLFVCFFVRSSNRSCIPNFFLSLLFGLFLQNSCSNCPDANAHADLELWWSYGFLDAVPHFMLVFYSKDPKILIDCTDAHACTYLSRTFLVRCFLGITLCFHLRLSIVKTKIKLCGCLLYWTTKHLWYPISLDIVNKQSNFEWKK